MKKVLFAVIAMLLCMPVAFAQDRNNCSESNVPGLKVEMSAEMKAYVNHLMGLDKPVSFANDVPLTASASSWSYPSSAPATPFGGGTGTETSPYLISTPQHLANLAYMVNNGTTYSGKYFKMTDDIVLNQNVLAADGSLNSGTFKSWVPIGGQNLESNGSSATLVHPFQGTFNGDGHFVSGLYFSNTSYYQVGLFGCVSNANISHINIIDSYLNAGGTVAGICGSISNSTVSYCYNSSTIIGNTSCVGGVVGEALNSSIVTACHNAGPVTGRGMSQGGTNGNCVGGVVGSTNGDIRVTYCINTGNIYGGANSVAGIASQGTSGAIIQNCINSGNVTAAASYVGSIHSTNPDFPLSSASGNNYYLEGTSANGSTYGTSKPASAFSDGTVLSLIDSSGTYFKRGPNGYPVLIGVGEGAGTPSVTPEDVTIGTGSTIPEYSKAPYGNYDKYATVEMIYDKSELGTAGVISSIAFNVASASSHATSSLNIYMGHKSSSTFSSTSDYMAQSNLTLVYSGAPTLGRTTGWETIDLTNPFIYNGTDNLVIVICRKAGNYTTGLKYYETAAIGKVLYRYSDDTSAYGDISNTSYSFSTYSDRPNIKVTKVDATASNYLYLDTIKTLPKTTTTVSLKMKNSAVISGFQFDLSLPSGVTLNSIAASSARTSSTYNISQRTQSDGSIRIVCISNGSASAKFTGNDGEVLKLTLTSTGTGDRNIILKNQILTTSTLSDITPVSQTARMHVHSLTSHVAVAATCTTTGNSAYWSCSGCGKYYTTSSATTETTLENVTIAALGHSYGTEEWNWTSHKHIQNDFGEWCCGATDNEITVYFATVKKTCARTGCTHEISATATITNAVTTAATCTTEGVRTYTAAATLDGSAVSDTKTEVIPALGHDLSSVDNGDGTHTTTCSRCSHSVTESHTFADGTCSVCGAEDQADGEDTDLSAYDNVIYIEGTDATAGSRKTLSLKMNNTIGMTGFQCDVYLPEGVEIAVDADDFYEISLSTERTTAAKTNYFDSADQQDGSVRIMCSSTRSYTFSGNEGEVATITVNIAEGMEDGDYPLILKNIVLSDASANTYEIEQVKTTLSLSSYLLGDANNDTKINVGDFTAIANAIMGNPPATFVEKAADVNEDTKINVGDLTGVANLILYGVVSPSATAKAVPGMTYQPSVVSVDDCHISAGTEFIVAVDVTGSYSFSGYQFDMTLPEGISVKMNGDEPYAWLSTARTSEKRTNFFATDMMNENTVRILAASTNGYTFDGNEGSVAYVTLVADRDIANGAYNVGINNIVLSANGGTYMPNATNFTVQVGNATGINGVMSEDGSNPVYDLSGKMVKRSSSTNELKKGIYIINGNKITK